MYQVNPISMTCKSSPLVWVGEKIPWHQICLTFLSFSVVMLWNYMLGKLYRKDHYTIPAGQTLLSVRSYRHSYEWTNQTHLQSWTKEIFLPAALLSCFQSLLALTVKVFWAYCQFFLNHSPWMNFFLSVGDQYDQQDLLRYHTSQKNFLELIVTNSGPRMHMKENKNPLVRQTLVDQCLIALVYRLFQKQPCLRI